MSRVAVAIIGSGPGITERLHAYEERSHLPPLLIEVDAREAAEIAKQRGWEIATPPLDTGAHGHIADRIRSVRAIDELNRLRGEGFAVCVEVLPQITNRRAMLDLVAAACESDLEVVVG